MFSKSFILLAALGQAMEVRKGPDVFKGEMSIQSTEVLGVLTSVTVLEGNGCPAGSYKVQPFEVGKSPNTTIEFDPSIFVYNETIAPGPVSCGINFEFDYVISESDDAELGFGTRMELITRYDENDTTRESGFKAVYDLHMTIQDYTDDAMIEYVSWNEGPQNFQVEAFGPTTGTPGEIGTGNLSSTITISTQDGSGEFAVTSIAVGFGIWVEYERPQ